MGENQLMTDGELLTVSDVASRLKVHRETVLRWLRGGDLKGFRLGGTKSGWRVAEPDYAEFLAKRQTGDGG